MIRSSLGDVMEVDVPDSAIQECIGVSALGCVSRLMLQKNSSVAKESPLKGVSPGGSSSSMNDSPIFATTVDC